MKLENQVVSLELAKELKLLNVKQENNTYYWRTGGALKHELQYLTRSYTGQELTMNNDVMFEWCSAFTVAELGEMLPAGVFTDKGAVHDKKWVACFSRYSEFNRIKDGESVDCLTIEDTEADARAKMLIYLIKNKLITV